MPTSRYVLTSRAWGLLSGFAIAGLYKIIYVTSRVPLIPTLSPNVNINVTLYYLSQIAESMCPGPEPYPCESGAVNTAYNHLRRGVISQ